MMFSSLNINWLNKCRCGNRMHTVETVRGSHVRLFEDDAVKCNSCGREGVIQTFDGIATVLWETDEERAEGAAMTNNQLTREKVQWLHDASEEAAAVGIKLTMNPNELLMFTSALLAAMDSEPVVQPVMFIDGDISSDDADKLAKIIREFNEEDERPLAKMARIIRENPHPTNECDMPKAQPAPVVPTFDEWLEIRGSKPLGWVKDAMRESYDACRAAMLQAGTLTNEDTKQAWTGIPDIDNAINMLDRIDTLESCDDDRIEAVKTVLRRLAGNSPVIPDGYVMVPKEPTDEMIVAAMNCDDVLFNSDESFCVQFGNIYEAMIAAAPQPQNEPQNIPEIIPGWIPVSERMPEKNGTYQVWNGEHVGAVSFLFGSFQCLNPEQVTHWMPTAKPPREVNHG